MKLDIKIKKEELLKHRRDVTHLDAVQRFPSRIVENKKYKKEKYPKKYLKDL